MDSYSHMYHFVSIFTVNIVLYPPVIDLNALWHTWKQRENFTHFWREWELTRKKVQVFWQKKVSSSHQPPQLKIASYLPGFVRLKLDVCTKFCRKPGPFFALILIRDKSAWNFRVVFMYVIMHFDQLQGVQYYVHCKTTHKMIHVTIAIYR